MGKSSIAPLLTLLIFLTFSTQAQELKKVHQIQTIDWQSDSFEDLAFLKDYLKDTRVVMLGEQTHFDGATFDAKIRLIKFLTQQMGYDILAFESEFYGVEKAVQNIQKGATPKEELEKALFPMWTEANMFNDLLSLLQASPQISLMGFDNQIYTSYSTDQLPKDLQKTLTEYKIQLPETTWQQLTELLYNLSEFDNKAFSTEGEFSKDTKELLSTLRDSITKLPQEPQAYWSLILQNLQSSLQSAIYDEQGNQAASMKTRDYQMAQNLLYIMDKYPDRKIICWGASYHFANDLSQLQVTQESKDYFRNANSDFQESDTNHLHMIAPSSPMGNYIKEKYGSQIFSIAFTAYEGDYQIFDEKKAIPVPPENSIESKLKNTGLAYAFVPLANQAPFYSSPLGYLPLKHNWADAFDALFFTRKMYPSYKLSLEESELEDDKTEVAIESFVIEGTLIDAKASNQVISFANIGIVEKNIGSYSNNDGIFKLSIPNSLTNSNLHISAIGYQTVSLSIDSLRKLPSPITLKLTPERTILEEIVVSAKPVTAKSILKKAHRQIKQNYHAEAFSMDMFHRSKFSENDTLIYKLESLIKVYDEDGLQRMPWAGSVKKLKANLLQIRCNPENINRKPIMQNAWLIWGHDPVFTQSNLLSPSRMGNYELKLNGIVPFGEDYVYEIEFKCKNPSSFNVGYQSPTSFEGKIFIHQDNYAIVGFKAFMTREHDKKKLEKWKSKAESAQDFVSFDYRYTKDIHSGAYILSYARIKWQAQATYPSGITTSTTKTNEVMMMEFNGSTPTVLTRPLQKIKTSTPYRPEFWESYNLIPEEE